MEAPLDRGEQALDGGNVALIKVVVGPAHESPADLVGPVAGFRQADVVPLVQLGVQVEVGEADDILLAFHLEHRAVARIVVALDAGVRRSRTR